MRKKFLFLIFASLILGVLLVKGVLAVSATLRGEITDDGGDPYLLVWFEYGTTQGYGWTTPTQEKYGTGEFTYTVSGLNECTTYHYRACARHKNYNDTSCGQDQTFTTSCSVKVDLKANGSDGPITVSYSNRTITLSWTSQYADSCQASGDWSGSKSTSGSEQITLSSPKTYYFTLTCKNSATGIEKSDSVQVTLQTPGAPRVITKGVVLTN
jgi:hypothetical protein